MLTFLQIVLNGLMLGGILAIVSVGLTLIFGIVKLVNFAHGEFLMVGMYATYLLSTHFGVHPYATAVVVVPGLFILGVLTQRFLIQPLMASSNEQVQIFATVGLSITLMNLALMIFGADINTTPATGLRHVITFGPLHALTGQLWVFLVAILLVTGLQLLLDRTNTGRAIRAVAQNRVAARLMGINVNRIYMLTFGIGSACVGVGAVFIAPLYPASPTIGTYFVLTAFVVVVLGGLGSVPGAWAGAMVIGLIDSLSDFYLSSGVSEAIVFSVFLVILLLRPSGLFGRRLRLSHISP